MSEATYKINNSDVPRDVKCATVTDGRVCGHVIAAHGSNGMICAACPCREFTMPKPAEDQAPQLK